MSWPTKTMSQQMLDALDVYRDTNRPILEICAEFGVSSGGLGKHVKRLGLNRIPYPKRSVPSQWRGVTGPAHPVWKGIPYIDKAGYLVVYAPNHPFPRKNGQIKEHIRLMELRLGRRLLFDECVHHDDLDKRNNEGTNLVRMDRGEHSLLHRSMERGDRP